MAVKSKHQIFKLLDEIGLENLSNKIKKMIRYSIEITTIPADENQIQIGESRIGGNPDLPKSVKWPFYDNQPLSFICQINLQECNHLDKESMLPDTGILYFFYDAENQPWGYNIENKNGWKVIYIDDTSSLERKTPPDNLKLYNVFNPCKLRFTNEVTLPPFDSIFFDNLTLTKEERMKLHKFLYQIIDEEDQVNHRLIGYPEAIEGDMMMACQLVSNGLDYDNLDKYDQSTLEEHKRKVCDWTLLIQIDSDELNAGMAWGNFGRLYFWIKEEDLQKKNFDDVWLILQSE
jgi:uncharacterized protein YwqG